MPVQIVRAFALLKGACAEANRAFGKLDDRRADAIIQATDEAFEGKLDGNFPPRRLADGFGHAVEHEYERSVRQPRHRDSRRQFP